MAENDTFAEDAVNSHNEYRQRHGCSPLKIDAKVDLCLENHIQLGQIITTAIQNLSYLYSNLHQNVSAVSLCARMGKQTSKRR